MISVRQYFETLGGSFGEGWNHFWFTPRDSFTLCVLRIAVGLIALYNVAAYTPDLVALFGADGLLPVETVVALEQALDPAVQSGVRQSVQVWRFSYLDYLHSPTELYAAHIAGLVVLAAFTAGLLSRFANIAALLVVLSYYHRAPVLATPLEPLLCFALLYLCLAPSGAYLSIDAWLASRKRRTAAGAGEEPPARPSWLATVATRLIQVHLTVVLLMMMLSMVQGDVWWNGSAVWWLMSRPESRMVDLTWLHSAPFVVYIWTHLVVLFAGAMVVGMWNGLARPLLLAISIPLWGAMALITGLGGYYLMLLAAEMAFISPEAMRSLLARWMPGCCGAQLSSGERLEAEMPQAVRN